MQNKFRPGRPLACVYTREMRVVGPLARIARPENKRTMKHIPFAELPAAERAAVMDALHRCGVPLRQVCVSKTEEDARSVATVTAGGWYRCYDAEAGWVAQLERDLAAWRDATAHDPAAK